MNITVKKKKGKTYAMSRTQGHYAKSTISRKDASDTGLVPQGR